MINKLNVGQRLAVLIAVPLAIIVLLTISSLSLFSSVNQRVSHIYDNRIVPLSQLQNISDGYTAIIHVINKADKNLISPNKAAMQLQSNRQQINQSWSRYIQSNISDREKVIIDELKVLYRNANTIIDEATNVLTSMNDTLEYDEDGDTLITHYSGDLFEYIDPIAEKVALLSDGQRNIAKQESDNALHQYSGAINGFITAGVVSLLIIIASGIWTSRSISVPLNQLRETIENAERNKDLTVRVALGSDDEIGRVAGACQRMLDRFDSIVGDVESTSNKLQDYANRLTNATDIAREGVTAQTRETDQVATASTQMTHAIEEVSRNADQAAQAANEANRETSDGTKVLEDAIGSINSLADRIDAASGVINRVETDSAAIGSVLDVIRGIAEQTNLLALNAAIEAARAGEQGRGFAVVADEVRSLAQRTQQSTQEIQEMIERLQSGAQEAVKSMAQGTQEMQSTVAQAEKAGASLSAIASAVAMINDMNNQIASATEQQMSVSKEISRNAVNISDVAKTSEHSVEEVDQASGGLKEAANHLAVVVGEFNT